MQRDEGLFSLMVSEGLLQVAESTALDLKLDRMSRWQEHMAEATISWWPRGSEDKAHLFKMCLR